MVPVADPIAVPFVEPGGIERRVSRRYVCDLATSWRIRVRVLGLSVQPNLRNISTNGISLIVNQPLPPGALLTLELCHLQRAYRRMIDVHVVYCIEHPNGEWIVGGRCTQPLAHNDLAILTSGWLI